MALQPRTAAALVTCALSTTLVERCVPSTLRRQAPSLALVPTPNQRMRARSHPSTGTCYLKSDFLVTNATSEDAVSSDEYGESGHNPDTTVCITPPVVSQVLDDGTAVAWVFFVP